MTDVSCRVILPHLEFMEHRDLSVDKFLSVLRAEVGEGQETDRTFLSDASNWISWRTFAAMCRQWEALYKNGLEEEFFNASSEQPYWLTSMLLPVVRVISTPAQLYWLVNRWGGPFNFPNLRSSYVKERGDRIILTLHAGEHQQPAPFFFRTTALVLARLPRLIGYPDALVEAEAGDRGAVYRIVLPPSQSLLSRLGRRLKAILAVPMLITELAQRDTQLRNTYMRLQHARSELEEKVGARTRALEETNRELSDRVEALRQAEKIAHIGSWEWDAAKRILTWSDETYRIFGVTKDHQTLSGEAVTQRTHPEDLHILNGAYLSAAQTGGAFSCEHRIVLDSGEIRHVRERGEVYLDDAGAVVRSMGTVHDITLQKRYEATLIQAKIAADEASHAKTRFLANMSHEIRTPMSSILGFVELLDDADLQPARRQAYMEKILRNGRHLLALIDDALDLAKVEAGHLAVQSGPCSPAQELTQAVDLLRAQADAKRLELTLDMAAPFPEAMRTDPIRFRQILLNVIGNAIKFTTRGGVHVRAREADGMLEVIVRDSGAGVAAPDRSLLFQPFSQAPGTPRHSGSGLGLALARRLARALSGDVELVDSTPRVGSTFKITVSLTLPDTTETRQPSSPAEGIVAVAADGIQDVRPRLEGMRVLVVEDTLDIQELLRRIIESAGATATVAGDGIECLEQIDKGTFDVVLLDMHMPRLDGFETVSRLRATGFKQPVIALTAYAMVDERKRSFEAGCDDFLAKPVDTQTLLRALGKWQQQRPETSPSPA